MVFIAVIIGILVVACVAYLVYPPFGGKTPVRQKQASPNFNGRVFVNQVPTSVTAGLSGILAILKQYTSPHPNQQPPRPITPDKLTEKSLQASGDNITWFGHSAFLAKFSDKYVMFDPMLSKRPSPFQFIGPKRFSASLPARIDELPELDAVVISHDHYDHLDYDSIKRLAGKTKKFFVPLGLGAHLQKWGVQSGQIVELDWWQSQSYQGMTLTCTPARHFSGRSLTDRNATLWCSWVVDTPQNRVFFSGDGGYGPHFAEIGKAHGPFDLTLLECGQYDPLWPDVHMTPEQTAQANQDLRGKKLIPMHWGAFKLAFHTWTDPVQRVLQANSAYTTQVLTPKIGETVPLSTKAYQTKQWWQDYS